MSAAPCPARANSVPGRLGAAASEAAKAMLGADLEAMQDYLRVSYRASVNRSLEHANRSSDAQRVDATVPRDNVELYRRLHAIGLQYGPAFQLLQNVRVPPEEAA